MKKVLLILGLIFILFSCKINLDSTSKSILRIENKKVIDDCLIVNNGHGSGFFINSEGLIVTNYHVIKGADMLNIIDSEGVTHTGIIISYSISDDIAILTIHKKVNNYLELGNSDEIEIGEEVYSIGYPLGLGMTVTKGIISNKSTYTGLSRSPLIQHDAPINPGASGSPLLNDNGEVIGINCGLYSRNGLHIGYSFTIPINSLKQIMKDLKLE